MLILGKYPLTFEGKVISKETPLISFKSGPLAQGNTLVALVSWGPSPCARPNAPGGNLILVNSLKVCVSWKINGKSSFPTVFVWVSYYLDWIAETQRNN